jgi:hypothetical protein
MSSHLAPAATRHAGNLLLDCYDRLGEAAVRGAGPPAVTGFAPDPRPPAPQPWLADLLAPAVATWQEAGRHAGHRLVLLNLARDPGTGTTKTFPSLLIVARAVAHVRDTGERVLIVSPTSGNKGVALRAAVARALELGLVGPDDLRVLTISPAATAYKLRADRLSADARLRRLNPALVLHADDPEAVKLLAREFAAAYADRLWTERRVRLWYTLDLANYIVADTGRAWFEQHADPAETAARPRVHVQAVSSAYGLLGYHLGRDLLEAASPGAAAHRPATLAVQHLATPHMVLHLLHGDPDAGHAPAYRRVFPGGVLSQTEDPHFPYVADSVDETVDGTFYSARPPTSARLRELVRRHGGDGIVVSRIECLARYPALRPLLRDAGFTAPADPRRVREWSLVMALTGAINAADRGLLPADCDLVVHATGWYTDADYVPMPAPAASGATAADVAAELDDR